MKLRVTRTTDARFESRREVDAWRTNDRQRARGWRGYPKKRWSDRSATALKISDDTLTHFSGFCPRPWMLVNSTVAESYAPEVNSGCQLKRRTRDKRNGFHKSLVLVCCIGIDTCTCICICVCVCTCVEG